MYQIVSNDLLSFVEVNMIERECVRCYCSEKVVHEDGDMGIPEAVIVDSRRYDRVLLGVLCAQAM